MAAQVTSGSGLVFAKGEHIYLVTKWRGKLHHFAPPLRWVIVNWNTFTIQKPKNLTYFVKKLKNSLGACFCFLKNKKSLSFDFLSWKADWTIHLSVDG